MNILLLGATALTLGLRHGLDIDHLAAILDMAGTTATEKDKTEKHTLRSVFRDMRLPAMYVAGHGVMVIVLGLAALYFGAVIPGWVDKIMERTVGVTLLILAAYLIYSLVIFAKTGREFVLRSRWMLVFAAAANAWDYLKHRLFHSTRHRHPDSNWDHRSAFTIGLIHGFGAETGTQVLLFASVAGLGSITTGLYMLIVFTVGMMISTLSIGACMAAGLATSRYFKSVVVVLGVLAAVFSLVVGLFFTLGAGDSLPSL